MTLESDRPDIQEPIGVLGYGVEGKSTCAYLQARGFADITVFDRKAPRDLPAGVRYAGDGSAYLSGLPAMRTVFRSAGVRADGPEIADFLARGGTLTSQTGLAFALAGRKRIIGVTGTLGKGTTCSLLHAMLTQAGIKSRLGGNIGVPALDLAAALAPDEFLILELSSFQLSTLATSPGLAVVVRTTTEHLDWHLDRDEYWLHKANLAAHQDRDDLLIYCGDAAGSAWIAERSPARKLAYGAAPGSHARIAITGPSGPAVTWVTPALTIPLSATRLTGAFNLENIAAAGSAALALGAPPEAVRAAAEAFPGLEHRLEFVRERNGVSFYNDSYATRPEAALGAVAALSAGPLGLILGGSEKHADFQELADVIAVSAHVRAVALIGETAGRIRAALLRAGAPRRAEAQGGACEGGFVMRQCPTLEAALEFLIAEIPRGAIALSPACASFGMFENYKERGKAFKRLVIAL